MKMIFDYELSKNGKVFPKLKKHYIKEKEKPIIIEPIIEEPSVSKAVEILTRVPRTPVIQEVKIQPPVQLARQF